MANQKKGTAMAAVVGFFKVIGGFFSSFGTAVAKGDLFVKLSLLWWGAGYVRRKQYIKAVIMTALEAAVILFTIFFAMDYVPKFGSLGQFYVSVLPGSQNREVQRKFLIHRR